MQADSSLPLKIEPEFLGSLGDRPLAEQAKHASPDDLFPGVSSFLGNRHHVRRRRVWEAVIPQVRRLIGTDEGTDEHILYVAQAMQVPPVFQMLSLGYLAAAYHQVVLVFTDVRLIEVLLGFRGKEPESRIRSYPWKDAKNLRLRFRTLSLFPDQGKKQNWTLPLRGDRKILKLILPHLTGRLLREGSGAAGRLPIWHCSQCGAGVSARPAQCASCSTLFRSPAMAAWLSLAFPGAGLLYAGRPVLASLDFLGEILFFFIVAGGLAASGNVAEAIGIVVLGVMFLAATKGESIHVGHIFATRTQPETPERRSGFRRFGMVGGALSVVAIASAILLTGSLAEIVDRDLEMSSEDSAWVGSRSVADWEVFDDDPSARSQWTHEDGLLVTVFAYPLESEADKIEFRRSFNETMAQEGTLLVEDEQIPAPLEGFRYVQSVRGPDGEDLTSFNYFVFDPEGTDVHQVFTAVDASRNQEAEHLLADLLTRARWVDAVPLAVGVQP
jgi:hypothetical protein